MPTYEYACRDCGEHLEVVQSFKDEALTVCPHCQGQLRKVFSAAGLIFKGSGWHIKDYATSTRSSSKDSDTSSGGKDAGPSSGGQDAGTGTSDSGAASTKPTGDGSSSGTKAATASPSPEKKSA